jgi:predicted RNA-binding Zn-ribbon protein involved in translation (DUF1610 family)
MSKYCEICGGECGIIELKSGGYICGYDDSPTQGAAGDIPVSAIWKCCSCGLNLTERGEYGGIIGPWECPECGSESVFLVDSETGKDIN